MKYGDYKMCYKHKGNSQFNCVECYSEEFNKYHKERKKMLKQGNSYILTKHKLIDEFKIIRITEKFVLMENSQGVRQWRYKTEFVDTENAIDDVYQILEDLGAYELKTQSPSTLMFTNHAERSSSYEELEKEMPATKELCDHLQTNFGDYVRNKRAINTNEGVLSGNTSDCGYLDLKKMGGIDNIPYGSIINTVGFEKEINEDLKNIKIVTYKNNDQEKWLDWPIPLKDRSSGDIYEVISLGVIDSEHELRLQQTFQYRKYINPVSDSDVKLHVKGTLSDNPGGTHQEATPQEKQMRKELFPEAFDSEYKKKEC